jgi:hypothetical protein
VELFTVAAAELGRLVEMCADDAAARRHGAVTDGATDDRSHQAGN